MTERRRAAGTAESDGGEHPLTSRAVSPKVAMKLFERTADDMDIDCDDSVTGGDTMEAGASAFRSLLATASGTPAMSAPQGNGKERVPWQVGAVT